MTKSAGTDSWSSNPSRRDALLSESASSFLWRGRSASEADAEAVESALLGLAKRKLLTIEGTTAPEWDSGADRTALRLWRCLEYHGERSSEEPGLALDRLIGRLERGDLSYGRTSRDLLLEVALAEALQAGSGRAAEAFEVEYMPSVRAVAGRLGGGRAVDSVENFAAELILPRDGRPPRISLYVGRTPLTDWLRSVVVNRCISQSRKEREISVDVDFIQGGQPGLDLLVDRVACRKLLEPIFASAAGALEAVDRLVLKMLLLDGAPQGPLAQSLGIHTGTLTRRRQRAGELLVHEVARRAERSENPRMASECLQSVLAGDDPVLRDQLSHALALGVRGESTDGDADS